VLVLPLREVGARALAILRLGVHRAVLRTLHPPLAPDAREGDGRHGLGADRLIVELIHVRGVVSAPRTTHEDVQRAVRRLLDGEAKARPNLLLENIVVG